MKKRIDILISQKFDFSRTRAQALIEEGCVQVFGRQILKPSELVDEESELALSMKDSFVSRGAFKLLGAIKEFGLKFDDLIVLDMGASTGGFSEVAIRNGAKKVYSVDVGRDELDKSLAINPKIVNMQGRDIRSLTKEEVGDADIVIGDLSFISLKHILPKINELFGKIECVILFKPQFECGKDIAKKFRGVIKDRAVHQSLLKDFLNELDLYNFKLSNLAYSPIKGKNGNIEYLMHINGKNNAKVDINEVVKSAFSNL